MIKQNQIINKDISLLEALDIMDNTDRKLLIICEDSIFLGVISIGDIQRAILNKYDLSQRVIDFVRSDIIVATTDDDIELIKSKMRTERIESMPIVDDRNKLVDVIEWEDLFDVEKPLYENVGCPVVIMAGGKGTRLLPLTNIIPKPLIPISDRTVIEEIMHSFKNVGCNKFFISVNYKKEVIENYFSERGEWDIEYIYEEKPLGTIGALSCLKNRFTESFFVINCDTLVDVDIMDLMDYHKTNENIITVVSVVKKMDIPYGTLDLDFGGVVKGIKEKPKYVYQINSGMYILEPEALMYIGDNTFTNITDLMELLIKKNKKVGAYPVSEKAWVDMGNWNEYLRVVEKYSSN